MTDNKAEQILQAEKEIRKEGAKAAALHGTVEATVFFVVVYFVLSVVVSVPLIDAVSVEAGVEIPGALIVSLALALVFLVADAYLVYRRRTLEYFEEVNPQVNEALRTARDAANRGDNNEMAEALYDDVLEKLKTTSSDGFVSMPRIAGSVVLVFAVAFLLLTATLGGYGGGQSLFSDETTTQGGGGGEGESEAGGGSGSGEAQEELQNADDVLGESGEVSRGANDRNVELDRSGSGGEGGGGTGSVGEGSDMSNRVEVEGQRTEFSPEEEIEDAELVKEYNLRVRSDE
ncbi:MAG: hypothetical protein U5J64_02025 [Halobacteriales archaeon]|nr:hypothetical protein [Halobacteriales archaeon]